jgi:predicted nucleotidyltransferase
VKVIMEGLVGSHLYGFATPESDFDYKGVYVAPTEEVLSLKKPKEHIVWVDGDKEGTRYEVEKFMRLAAQANPSILELLYLPRYDTFTAEGAWLREARKAFLSTRVRQTYGGYVHQQVHKLRIHEGDYFESKVRNRYEKHARHIARLLSQCEQLLRTGVLDPVVSESEREEIYNIGQQGVDFIEKYVERRLKRIDACKTPLPDEPDYEAINRVLLSIRKAN